MRAWRAFCCTRWPGPSPPSNMNVVPPCLQRHGRQTTIAVIFIQSSLYGPIAHVLEPCVARALPLCYLETAVIGLLSIRRTSLLVCHPLSRSAPLGTDRQTQSREVHGGASALTVYIVLRLRPCTLPVACCGMGPAAVSSQGAPKKEPELGEVRNNQKRLFCSRQACETLATSPHCFHPKTPTWEGCDGPPVGANIAIGMAQVVPALASLERFLTHFSTLFACSKGM